MISWITSRNSWLPAYIVRFTICSLCRTWRIRIGIRIIRSNILIRIRISSRDRLHRVHRYRTIRSRIARVRILRWATVSCSRTSCRGSLRARCRRCRIHRFTSGRCWRWSVCRRTSSSWQTIWIVWGSRSVRYCSGVNSRCTRYLSCRKVFRCRVQARRKCHSNSSSNLRDRQISSPCTQAKSTDNRWCQAVCSVEVAR
jgi:hypothetical protein